MSPNPSASFAPAAQWIDTNLIPAPIARVHAHMFAAALPLLANGVAVLNIASRQLQLSCVLDEQLVQSADGLIDIQASRPVVTVMEAALIRAGIARLERGLRLQVYAQGQAQEFVLLATHAFCALEHWIVCRPHEWQALNAAAAANPASEGATP